MNVQELYDQFKDMENAGLQLSDYEIYHDANYLTTIIYHIYLNTGAYYSCGDWYPFSFSSEKKPIIDLNIKSKSLMVILLKTK